MPIGWTRCTIGEFEARGEIELTTGPFGTQLKAAEYVDSGVPVINVRNIGFGTIREEKLEYLSDETVKRLSKHLLVSNDIVFGRKGAVERHAFIQNGHGGWFQGSDCLRLRVCTTKLLPRFLSYRFLSQDHQAWMINQCSHGATMASLNQDILKRIPLDLPPLATQRKIAAILSAYDDLIENNLRRIKILEAMAQNLYREWFVKFRFPGHQHARLVDSPLGPIPEGWEVGTLTKMFQGQKSVVLTGPFGSKLHASDYAEEGTPLILVKHVKDGRLVEKNMPLVGEPKLSEMARYRLKEGDIVVTRVGYVGESAYIHSEHEGWLFSGQTLRVRLPKNEHISSRFLAAFYAAPTFLQLIERFAVGATRLSLNTKILSDMEFLVPPKGIQDEYSRFVRPFDTLYLTLNRRIQVLRQTRDLLLPKLISGELDVSELDIAIPEELAEAPASPSDNGNPARVSAPKPSARTAPRAAEEPEAYGEPDTEAPSAPVPIEEWDTNAVMAAFRQAARKTGQTDRDTLLKAVSQELGYGRLGSKIKAVLKGHLKAAIRRHIIGADGPTVWPETRTMDSFERDELVDTLVSVMRKGARYDREDVYRAVANHLGFRRLTDSVRDPIKSAINGAIRRGVLGYEGDVLWREE